MAPARAHLGRADGVAGGIYPKDGAGCSKGETAEPGTCGTRRRLLRYVADTMNNGGVFMTTQSPLDTSIRETPSLVGSDKVEGTAVYRSNVTRWGL
jgi:hypothetical protein